LTNLDKIHKLIDEFLKVAPASGDAVIFGSAAIVLRNIDLRRDIQDLDLFVSKEAFDELDANVIVVTKPDGVLAKKLAGAEVEILHEFPGADHRRVFENAAVLDGSRGLRVAALADLIAWKRAQGREKDLADLARIAAFQATKA
jgi:hypothetical protein